MPDNRKGAGKRETKDREPEWSVMELLIAEGSGAFISQTGSEEACGICFRIAQGTGSGAGMRPPCSLGLEPSQDVKALNYQVCTHT